jgi:hypothetical protein
MPYAVWPLWSPNFRNSLSNYKRLQILISDPINAANVPCLYDTGPRRDTDTHCTVLQEQVLADFVIDQKVSVFVELSRSTLWSLSPCAGPNRMNPVHPSSPFYSFKNNFNIIIQRACTSLWQTIPFCLCGVILHPFHSSSMPASCPVSRSWRHRRVG